MEIRLKVVVNGLAVIKMLMENYGFKLSDKETLKTVSKLPNTPLSKISKKWVDLHKNQ